MRCFENKTDFILTIDRCMLYSMHLRIDGANENCPDKMVLDQKYTCVHMVVDLSNGAYL